MEAGQLEQAAASNGAVATGVQRAGGLYTIGDLAREADVSARTIRYYEEIGLLRTARRFAGGRRAFDADALERLRFIGRLKRLGLSLAEIRHLNDVFAMQHSTAAMLEVLDGLLGEHLETVETRLAELAQLREEIGTYRVRIRSRRNGRNGAQGGGSGSPNGRNGAHGGRRSGRKETR